MWVKERINLISGGERNLYWRLTAKENLEYFGSLYGLSGNVLRDRIEELLKLVELEEAADMSVERYSKGMKQRLQIARGLINDPEYIFLDEEERKMKKWWIVIKAEIIKQQTQEYHSYFVLYKDIKRKESVSAPCDLPERKYRLAVSQYGRK